MISKKLLFNECIFLMSEDLEEIHRSGTEAGLLGIYNFPGSVYATDGSNDRGIMGAGFFKLDEHRGGYCQLGRGVEGNSSNRAELFLSLALSHSICLSFSLSVSLFVLARACALFLACSLSLSRFLCLHPPSPSKFTPFYLEGLVQYMFLSADPRALLCKRHV